MEHVKMAENAPAGDSSATQKWKEMLDKWKQTVDIEGLTNDLQDAGFAVKCCWVGSGHDAPPEAAGAAAVHTVGGGQGKAIITVAWTKPVGFQPPPEAMAIIRRHW